MAGLAALLATPAAAGDMRPADPARAAISTIDYALSSPAEAKRMRGVDATWDGSSLHVALDRLRIGNKRPDPNMAVVEPWIRQLTLEARYDYEFADGLTLSLGGTAAYVKSGTLEGPLLTRNSTVLSREIGVSLSLPRTYLALSQFRSGGWDQASLRDTANRMANGERAARRGVALEAGFAGVGEPRLALRVEQARAGDWANDSRAFVSWTTSY